MKKIPGIRKRSAPTLSLRKWHIGLAAFYTVQAVIILVLSKTNEWPITTNFSTQDTVASKVAGHPVLVPAAHTLLSLNLAYAVAAFFLVSVVVHLAIATVYQKRHKTDLAHGMNCARWIEHGLSVGIMMVVIGLLSGIYDISSMVMILVLVSLTSLVGPLMEHTSRGHDRRSRGTYLVGYLAAITPWIVFAIYAISASAYGDGVPAFVYWIYLSIFILFNSFAINMYLQYKRKGRWADYLYGERIYMILSLITKTVLAWQVFAGALR